MASEITKRTGYPVEEFLAGSRLCSIHLETLKLFPVPTWLKVFFPLLKIIPPPPCSSCIRRNLHLVQNSTVWCYNFVLLVQCFWCYKGIRITKLNDNYDYTFGCEEVVSFSKVSFGFYSGRVEIVQFNNCFFFFFSLFNLFRKINRNESDNEEQKVNWIIQYRINLQIRPRRVKLESKSSRCYIGYRFNCLHFTIAYGHDKMPFTWYPTYRQINFRFGETIIEWVLT